MFYNNDKKIPTWAAEHITKNKLSGPALRQNCYFKPDYKISERFRSRNEDYLGSGFARGHMVPAGKYILLAKFVKILNWCSRQLWKTITVHGICGLLRRTLLQKFIICRRY